MNEKERGREREMMETTITKLTWLTYFIIYNSQLFHRILPLYKLSLPKPPPKSNSNFPTFSLNFKSQQAHRSTENRTVSCLTWDDSSKAESKVLPDCSTSWPPKTSLVIFTFTGQILSRSEQRCSESGLRKGKNKCFSFKD